MRSKALVFVLLLLLVPVSEVALAQANDRDEDWWYVAAYAGGVHADELTDVDDDFLGDVSDLDMQDGYTGGLKLGFVPGRRWTWINWEFEYWYANPRIKGGQSVQTDSGPATFVAGVNLNVHTVAWNFILRRNEGVIQPYVGVGPSLVYVDAKGATIDDEEVNFGVNFLAGMRLMAWDKIGVFGEVKYNRSTLDLDTISGDYRPLAGVAGVVIHFDSFPTLIF